MGLQERIVWLNHWNVWVLFIPLVFIAIVNQRTTGNVISAILYAGRQSVFSGARSRNSLDTLSKTLLFFFTAFALFSCLFQAKSAHYSIGLTVLFSVGASLFWMLDYFFVWIITQNKKFIAAYFSRGNLLWHMLGGALFMISVAECFIPSYSFSFLPVVLVYFVFFIARTVYGLLYSNDHHFSWYYIILYLCAVYLVPMALVLSAFGRMH
ncbi:MAG: hypothetical protein RIQ90_702 [Bacteroidota bacterium]|jgi:preprotein translocase subunit SecG